MLRNTSFPASLVVLVLSTAACAPRSAAPADDPGGPAASVVTTAAADPAGIWDFSTAVEGQTISGVLRIERTDSGVYTAAVSTPMTPPMTGLATTVEGNRVAIRGADGLRMDLTVSGTGLTGSWGYSGMSGNLTATRR